MFARPPFTLALAFLPLLGSLPGSGQGLSNLRLPRAESVVVAWDDPDDGRGRVALLESAAPWGWASPPLSTDPGCVLHAAHGYLFAMSPVSGGVTRIAVEPWGVSDSHTLAPPHRLEGLAAASPERVYLTRSDSTHLWRFDHDTGNLAAVTDLAPLADADGNPDLGRLVIHGGHLIVQVRRFPEQGPWPPDLLPLLAWVDLSTETLIDLDPSKPGVQGLELLGTAPKLRMQILPRAGRLYVSSTGAFLDEGGIEEIDLVHRVSLGLIVREDDHQTGADIGPFVMTRPGRGFLAFSTDFALSSHLVGFRVPGGIDPAGELHVSLNYFAPSLVHAPSQGLVFLPHAESGAPGLHVFRASDGARLTPSPIPTDAPPTDVELLVLQPRPAPAPQHP